MELRSYVIVPEKYRGYGYYLTFPFDVLFLKKEGMRNLIVNMAACYPLAISHIGLFLPTGNSRTSWLESTTQQVPRRPLRRMLMTICALYAAASCTVPTSSPLVSRTLPSSAWTVVRPCARAAGASPTLTVGWVRGFDKISVLRSENQTDCKIVRANGRVRAYNISIFDVGFVYWCFLDAESAPIGVIVV